LNETTPIEAFEEIASEIEALQADISALRAEITNGGNPRHYGLGKGFHLCRVQSPVSLPNGDGVRVHFSKSH
jgi:hypothetical protein